MKFSRIRNAPIVKSPRRDGLTTSRIWIDVALSRASHFSQILLLLVTALTVWFTVIPLYQKEILSESIAQKELELAALKNEVIKEKERQYLRQRTQVRSRVLSSLELNCLGIMKDPTEARKITEGEGINYVFSIDLKDCIQRSLDEDSGVALLRPKDRAYLIGHVKSLQSTYAELRDLARKRYLSAEDTVGDKEAVLDADDPLSASILGLMQGWPEGERHRLLVQMEVGREERAAVKQWRDSAGEIGHALSKEPWPPSMIPK